MAKKVKVSSSSSLKSVWIQADGYGTNSLALWMLCSILVITFREGLGGTAQNSQITDPNEVQALQEIRRSLNDPFKNLSNWNRGDPCASNWTGVVCYNYNATNLSDGYLHVQKLDLLNMNLSGTLSPELGRLSYLRILDFMWNSISGSIPKEIANISTLELLLLNGNKLTGSLPEELGYLPNLDRIQIDENQISGPLPKSFANLSKTRHFHMNNNSINGQIPAELSRLPMLVHLLLDNNNLSGYLPPEFSELPNLLILQVDNNNFNGTGIPPSYSNMSKLLKLSLRNCSLQGPIPDLSRIQNLGYLDLSSNQLNGSLTSTKFSSNITTIDLSNNNISGSIPESTFSGLPQLQLLSVANNELVGSISSKIWQNITLNLTERVILDFQNNRLSNISGSINVPLNVSLRLQGNPICGDKDTNLVQFCRIQNDDNNNDGLNMTNSSQQCDASICPAPYESWSLSPMPCFCAAPLIVGYRLKSPGFTYFEPYSNVFEDYMSSGLSLYLYQFQINTMVWQKGPRLSMKLKIFPVNGSHEFNRSELGRLKSKFAGWNIKDSSLFGPYELLNFTLLDPYIDYFPPQSSGISKGALAGIVLGTIAGAVTLSAIVSLLIVRMHLRNHHEISSRRPTSLVSIKIDGVKRFTYKELVLATNNFKSSTQVGEGGYGKVYKGILSDGTIVAIKRAQHGSLQGEREFLTEIELLSRLHHRNLVSLIGYCDEEYEQMLVYEFMSNGTLRDHLSDENISRSKEALSFSMRLRIALGSAKGILYLHTEADPPIFHRDIKATNILLDSHFTAKVADFGLSRLAPVPDMEGSIPDHVSTVVKGTPGYLDPEYFLTHKLTDKSDVYSLGVVFLELFTGMQPISHGKNIVREVNAAYQSGSILSVIDSRMGSFPSECVERLLKLALRCCLEQTDMRPRMTDVVRELDTIWLMASSESQSTTKLITSEDNFHSTTGKEALLEMIPSSSSYDLSMMMMANPNVSTDVSGSDLVSGVLPTVIPR